VRLVVVDELAMAMKPAVVSVPPPDAIYIAVIIGGDPQGHKGQAEAKPEVEVIIAVAAVSPLTVVVALPLPVVNLDHI